MRFRRGALWPDHHTPNEIALMKPCMARSGHGAALIGFRHLGRVGFRLGLGRELGIATCLPSAGSVLRTSTSEQAVLNFRRLRSRPLVHGKSFGCWLSLWERLRWRPAPNPLSSAKNPNFVRA